MKEYYACMHTYTPTLFNGFCNASIVFHVSLMYTHAYVARIYVYVYVYVYVYNIPFSKFSNAGSVRHARSLSTSLFPVSANMNICVYIYIYTHTHTHTHSTYA
jgi:hypothetical protein